MRRDPAAVIRGVHSVLKKGGRFAAEMGGFANLASVHGALIAAVKRRGVADAENLQPWFPTYVLPSSNISLQIPNI